jgi:hypothetical protein
MAATPETRPQDNVGGADMPIEEEFAMGTSATHHGFLLIFQKYLQSF